MEFELRVTEALHNQFKNTCLVHTLPNEKCDVCNFALKVFEAAVAYIGGSGHLSIDDDDMLIAAFIAGVKYILP